jgi:hypothetical protein
MEIQLPCRIGSLLISPFGTHPLPLVPHHLQPPRQGGALGTLDDFGWVEDMDLEIWGRSVLD